MQAHDQNHNARQRQDKRHDRDQEPRRNERQHGRGQVHRDQIPEHLGVPGQLILNIQVVQRDNPLPSSFPGLGEDAPLGHSHQHIKDHHSQHRPRRNRPGEHQTVHHIIHKNLPLLFSACHVGKQK